MKPLFLLSLLLHSLSNAQWERVPEISETRLMYALLAAHAALYAGTDSLVHVGARSGT